MRRLQPTREASARFEPGTVGRLAFPPVQPPELEQDVLYGLNGQIGLEFDEITPDRVVASLEVSPLHLQPYGLVHGGIYCTLIEAAASTAGAYWALTQGFTGAVGISNTTDFLRSTREGRLVVEAEPIHRGRRQQLWQGTVIRGSDGKMAARGQVRLQNLESGEPIGGTTPQAG